MYKLWSSTSGTLVDVSSYTSTKLCSLKKSITCLAWAPTLLMESLSRNPSLVCQARSGVFCPGLSRSLGLPRQMSSDASLEIPSSSPSLGHCTLNNNICRYFRHLFFLFLHSRTPEVTCIPAKTSRHQSIVIGASEMPVGLLLDDDKLQNIVDSGIANS